jgi:hypothetical protein
MKKQLILPFLFVAFNTLFAQIAQSAFQGNQLLEKDYLYDTSNGFKNDNSDKNIRGSRYSTEAYCGGELVTKNGVRYRDAFSFKFDEFTNAIQVRFKDGKERVLFYNNVDSFRLFIGNTVVEYIKANVPDVNETNMFYQVIYASANYQLIKLATKKVVNVDTRNALGDGEKYQEFQRTDVYFIKKGSSKPFEKVKISKKSLLETLPNKKATLTKLFDSKPYKGSLDDEKLAALFKEMDN